MKNRSYTELFVFIAGIVGGIFFISLRVTGNDFTFFPGDYIDGRFNNYILEHCYLFFTGQTPDFWNAPFMFPEEDVLSYSDNLLGSAPFYMLYRLFGNDRETAFQYWFLTVTALNYVCSFLFLKYLFKNSYAAVCGALVFTFSIALHSQMGHAQTFPRFATPLAFLMLLKFYENPKPMFFFWAVFLVAYQMYCGIYLGFLLAIPFGIMLGFMVYLRRQDFLKLIKQRHWLYKIIAAALGVLIFLLPLLIPYFLRAKQTGFYPFDRVLSTLPTMGSYFFSWKGSRYWDSLSETCVSYPAFWDHEIFTGGFATFGFFVSVVVVIFGLLYKKGDWWAKGDVKKRLVLFTGLILFLLFLRVGNFSLYRLIYAIPGYGSMRALQRIINIELLFFAVGLAGFVNMVTNWKPLLSTGFTLILCAAIIADNYVDPHFIHRKEKVVTQQRVNPLIEQMKSLPPLSIVSYEPDTMVSMSMDYHLDGMLAAQSAGLKTLNGYSATSPGGFGPFWEKPNEANRKIWLERKGMVNLNVAVVH